MQAAESLISAVNKDATDENVDDSDHVDDGDFVVEPKKKRSRYSLFCCFLRRIRHQFRPFHSILAAVSFYSIHKHMSKQVF